ncbi:MAG: lysylphosphatidylglycerol synthase transmembrane domain-containing protein [Myxococcota bacterium]
MSRQRIFKAFKYSVTTALLLWVIASIVRQGGAASLGERLLHLRFEWIGAAVVLQFLAIVFGVLRWRELLRERHFELPLGWLVRVYFVGRFVGAFTPSTTGLDLYRVVEVARRTGRKAPSAAVLFAEKCIGLLGLVLLSLLLIPFGADRFLGASSFWTAVAMVVAAGLGLVGLARPAVFRAWIRWLPRRFADFGETAISALEERKPGVASSLRALGFGSLSHAATAAVFVGTGLSLGVSAPVLDLLIVGNVIIIATLLPISIGGVGVRESVAVMLLATLGVSASDATLVALLGYVVGQAPALVGGGYLLAPATGAQSQASATPLPTER